MTEGAAPKKPGSRADVAEFLATRLCADPAVRQGTMFGHPAFYVGRRMVACVYGAGVGLRLPRERVQALLGTRGIVPFEPYGRVGMREWIEIRRARAIDYRDDLDLFRESITYARLLGSRS